MEQKEFNRKIQKEKKEEFPVSTETVSADELEKIIYKDKHNPDKKFLKKENGGEFKYFDLRKLMERKTQKRELFYPLVSKEKDIVGICELEKSPYEENTYWISFMSVKDSEQGKGYGSKLAEETFRFAKEKEINIEGSIYSDIGREKLKSKLKELSEKYGVKFIDSDEKHKV
ncbi:N-acetyltransferase [Candidatus Parcubacteria bacterium]|jgi:predicted GNAT family acetyltransferase|nr:MAG: N-acetyltransferase [Candidatus Parcubacteria bacterium]